MNEDIESRKSNITHYFYIAFGIAVLIAAGFLFSSFSGNKADTDRNSAEPIRTGQAAITKGLEDTEERTSNIEGSITSSQEELDRSTAGIDRAEAAAERIEAALNRSGTRIAEIRKLLQEIRKESAS